MLQVRLPWKNMPLADSQGRLFGRLNVIDAAVLALVLLSLPVAYGAYALLHDPKPALASVEPPIASGQKGVRVRLHGRNLRPLLRVVVGTVYADPFLVQRADLAEIGLPELAPGTYDVALYDQGELLTRLPRALMIDASVGPTMVVQLVGAFTQLDVDSAAAIEMDAKFPDGAPDPVATVLAVKPAEPAVRRIRFGDAMVSTLVPGKLQVPAIIRLRCASVGDECLVGDTVVAPDIPITLPTAHGAVVFRVVELRSETAPLVFPGPDKGARP